MAFLSLKEIESKLTPQDKIEIEEIRSARTAGATVEEIYQIVKRQEDNDPNLTHRTLPPSVLNNMLGDLL